MYWVSGWVVLVGRIVFSYVAASPVIRFSLTILTPISRDSPFVILFSVLPQVHCAPAASASAWVMASWRKTYVIIRTDVSAHFNVSNTARSVLYLSEQYVLLDWSGVVLNELYVFNSVMKTYRSKFLFNF